MSKAIKNRSDKILALLPARGGSKRIKQKNIVDFFGKPIMAYSIQAAKESCLFDTIHVSTDDDAIAQVGIDMGVDVSFRRPKSLSDDVTGMLPVAQWVLREFEKQGKHFSAVVILFPAAPLLDAHDLTEAYKIYAKHEGRRNLITVCAAPAKREYYYRKDKVDGSLSAIEPGASFIRSQDLPESYFETGTFTIFSCDWLLNSVSLEDDTRYIGYEIPSNKAVDIDRPEDLDFAKVLFAAAKSITK